MRLKIKIEPKNYYLKIPVRVRVYARMFARAYDCQDSTSDTRRTHLRTHTTGKGRNTSKAEKPEYIVMIAGNEKKYKKKLKKIWKCKKAAVSL